ncbi:MAG: hypothetical protein LIP77_07705, partial [Planctomycetes bacterium]|nr:hypothetical protein [Planctomycetota bacterium]
MKALLGVQSHYSFHWGTAAPTAWLERAAALGYRWLGITDHAALQGLPEIVRSAAAGPVGFLVGASFPSSDGRLVMAFVATAEGYGNLCGRITAWLAASAARPAAAAGGIPALDPAAAREQFAGGDRSVGLAFLVDDMAIWDALRRAGAETYWRIGPDLTAPPAAVPADALVFAPGPLMLAPDDFTTHRLLRAIGGGITLDQLPEAPAVGRDPAPVLIARPEEYLRRPEEYRSRFAVYAAPPAAVPADALVFAPGPLMLAPDDFTTHRLLRAIGGGITLDQLPEAPAVGRDPAPVLIARPEEYLRRPEEYRSRFAVYAAAIDRADRLAERLAAFQPDQRIHCPPTPETGGDYAPDETAIARLRRLAYDGAAIRYGTVDAAVRARLDHELALIEKKRFSEYFLVVHDIANRLAGGDGRIHRGRSITCGRGSGAASLVNYCLGVTNVDVMKHDLMFERFLNDARSDPPDIDVDFAWDERDDLLERVLDSYGHSRVARVANHNRYDWRGAFRATARTLGFADAEITRRLRQPNGGSVLPAGHPPPATVPVVARARERSGLARRDGDDGWNLARELSRRLIDLPYCLSMHCGGVVISPGDLSRTVPLFLSRKGLPTIQWEKEGAEEMGLVKIDLLGNRSLAVIRDAIRDVSRSTGIPEGEVIAGDPTDDDATRELLRTGNTFGVFYLESPSMRLLMAKARIGDFRHAVIHSSIIRPAANAFINEYLRRLHGKPWQPEHEKLRGLFDESYGIPVYQEDVVKLTMRLCGYGYSQADRIRKILGKRNAREGIARIFPDHTASATATGLSDADDKES